MISKFKKGKAELTLSKWTAKNAAIFAKKRSDFCQKNAAIFAKNAI